MDAADLINELILDTGMYRRTGGGVTFSGGEPTLQSAFLREILHLCKMHGLSTAVDTCGFCEGEQFESICRETDLVLFDIKHMDSEQHRSMTCMPNELIIQNARRLSTAGIRMCVRIPIIPGYNDDIDNIKATSKLISELDTVDNVMLLGYHKLGLAKVYGFGFKQRDSGLMPPSREHMQALREYLQESLPGIPVSYR